MTAKLIIAAACGAFGQEILYWYNLRARLRESKLRSLAREPLYWIITIGTIAVSTMGTFFWYDGINADARHYLILGASFPLIFKAAVPALAAKKTTLGPKSSILRAYFGLEGGD